VSSLTAAGVVLLTVSVANAQPPHQGRGGPGRGGPPDPGQKEEQEAVKKCTVYPIGWVRKAEGRTKIVVDKKYQPGLLGLEHCSEVWVLYWLDGNDIPEKRSILQVEPRPGPSDPPDPGKFFSNADRNEDGKLTKEDVPESLWSRLSMADADNDGAVSKGELAKVFEKRRHEGERTRRGEGPGARGNKNAKIGVFATHWPVRPNLIAMSRCKIISVKDNVIEIEDIDAWPDTPVLDLKNYFTPMVSRSRAGEGRGGTIKEEKVERGTRGRGRRGNRESDEVEMEMMLNN